MSQLLEWSPLIAFFVAFKLFDIYWATAALMLASTIVLFVHRWRTGTYKTMHVATVAAVMVLGTATLLFHDKRFIQWKPTVLLGLVAVAFLGSSIVGKQPLARRLLEGVFNEPLQITPQAWNYLNALWTAWFALLAGANIWVARNFSENIWVNFHFFGVSIAMLVFMLPQVFWLSTKTRPVPSDAAPP